MTATPSARNVVLERSSNVVLERSSRLVTLALTAFALCASGMSPAGAAQKLPLAGMPAPAISVPIIANGSGIFVLKQHLGHPVYINFFASWCEPCKEEVQTIQTVTAEPALRNVVVIGIAELDEPSAAKRFAQTHGLRYPIALDQAGYIGAAYRLNELPLHVFIGADGIVKQYVEGGPIPAAELRTGLTEISKTP